MVFVGEEAEGVPWADYLQQVGGHFSIALLRSDVVHIVASFVLCQAVVRVVLELEVHLVDKSHPYEL